MVIINNNTANDPIFIGIMVLTMIACFFVLRKFVNYEYAKNEKVKDFALDNISEIESITLKGSKEVFCLVKMKNKEAQIAGEGVDSVSFYLNIITKRPELNHLK